MGCYSERSYPLYHHGNHSFKQVDATTPLGTSNIIPYTVIPLNTSGCVYTPTQGSGFVPQHVICPLIYISHKYMHVHLQFQHLHCQTPAVPSSPSRLLVVAAARSDLRATRWTVPFWATPLASLCYPATLLLPSLSLSMALQTTHSFTRWYHSHSRSPYLE